MKKIVLLLIAALLTLNMAAQERMAEKLGKIDGVTFVHVSKTMLRLAGGFKAGDADLANVVGKLDNVWVITSDNSGAAKKLAAESRKMIANDNFESLMSVNDGDEQVNIYMKDLSDSRKYYVLVCSEPGEATVTILTGKLTLQDLQSIAGN